MLIALIADHVRVIHTVEVLSANHADAQHAHRSLNEVSMRLLGPGKLLLRLPKLRVVCQDALLDLSLAFHKLVLRHNVLLGEFIEVDAPVCIVVQLLEQLLYNLRAMLIVDTLSSQEIVHFVSIDLSIAVGIDGTELLSETLFF